jgi:hypothetical protein
MKSNNLSVCFSTGVGQKLPSNCEAKVVKEVQYTGWFKKELYNFESL